MCVSKSAKDIKCCVMFYGVMFNATRDLRRTKTFPQRGTRTDPCLLAIFGRKRMTLLSFFILLWQRHQTVINRNSFTDKGGNLAHCGVGSARGYFFLHLYYWEAFLWHYSINDQKVLLGTTKFFINAHWTQKVLRYNDFVPHGMSCSHREEVA